MYIIIDTQKRVYGRYNTLEQTYSRMSQLPRLKTYRVLIEESLKDFDGEIYYNLNGSRASI